MVPPRCSRKRNWAMGGSWIRTFPFPSVTCLTANISASASARRRGATARASSSRSFVFDVVSSCRTCRYRPRGLSDVPSWAGRWGCPGTDVLPRSLPKRDDGGIIVLTPAASNSSARGGARSRAISDPAGGRSRGRAYYLKAPLSRHDRFEVIGEAGTPSGAGEGARPQAGCGGDGHPPSRARAASMRRARSRRRCPRRR